MEPYFTVGIHVPTLVIGCERYSVGKIAVLMDNSQSLTSLRWDTGRPDGC